MDYTIKHNENDFRFETEVDGYLAYVEYTPLDKELDLIHTWVPKEIGGKGNLIVHYNMYGSTSGVAFQRHHLGNFIHDTLCCNRTITMNNDW